MQRSLDKSRDLRTHCASRHHDVGEGYMQIFRHAATADVHRHGTAVRCWS